MAHLIDEWKQSARAAASLNFANYLAQKSRLGSAHIAFYTQNQTVAKLLISFELGGFTLMNIQRVSNTLHCSPSSKLHL